MKVTSISIIIASFILLGSFPTMAAKINLRTGPTPALNAKIARLIADYKRTPKTYQTSNYGSGNQVIGDFSNSNNRQLREVNIIADDIININIRR
ncbi:MAG: hypothetical protein KDJ99_25390 [Candidatus Competibacteraceae bacterium]|nr:hypothetical protein [Candidatus Competibacteraceae bacterium]